MSIKESIGEQNVVYFYNGILSSPKKEGQSHTCYHINEP